MIFVVKRKEKLMEIKEAIQNVKKWLVCINRDDLDCLRVCDSCQNHVEAATLYESLTVIVADAEKKTDEDKQLIKWLRELQAWRKAYDNCVNTDYESIDDSVRRLTIIGQVVNVRNVFADIRRTDGQE